MNRNDWTSQSKQISKEASGRARAINETEGAEGKKEPVGSPGAIYFYLLLSSKGWRGRELHAERIRGNGGRVSAGDAWRHTAGYVSDAVG